MGKKGKWFSAVKKVFSSSDPVGKEAKVCQTSQEKNDCDCHLSFLISICMTYGCYEGGEGGQDKIQEEMAIRKV